MPGVARQGTGSSPQSALPEGADVSPREEPKSNTWNRSPARNASVTVRTTPAAGARNVQGAAGRKPVLVPELDIQNGPAGSAGSQPVAGVPTVENPNSRKVPSVIGSAAAGVAHASAAAAMSMPALVFRM